MQIQHTDFVLSPSLRSSLKRGRAREVLSFAQQDEADIPALIAAAGVFRPNEKARIRLAQRLGRLPGVVSVTRGGGGTLHLVSRNTRHVVTRKEAADIFSETAVIYTWMRLSAAQGRVCFKLRRASFGLHALERLFERSDLALDRPMLSAVDAEACKMFHNTETGVTFEDHGDSFIPARMTGVWAGSWDDSAIEDDWGLSPLEPGNSVPVFSARTFLGPEQMRPSIWLRWTNDPQITID